MIQKNDKTTIRAWAIFDWANSAYALVISTAIFPPFFEEMTDPTINFLGTSVKNTALFSFSISFSYLVLAILNPILAGIADGGSKRKFFLKLFTTLGAFACMSLFFFKTESYVWWGTLGFVLATIGFTSGTVFYNAYLPEIVTEDKYDQISAKGFAYGYIGSVILLIAILILIMKPELFGMESSSLQPRIGFLLVGIWWIGFAQYSFLNLPEDHKENKIKAPLTKGFTQLKSAIRKIQKNVNVKKFLASFFFYIAGLNTVVYLATIFAKKELGIGTSELIITVLVIQLVGIAGAYLFAFISQKNGNKISLISMIIIWMVVCLVGFFVSSTFAFYALSAGVGLVMGGTQAVSRSTFAKMIGDRGNEVNSLFSLYDSIKNVAIVSGTLVFGLVDQLIGMRYSILSLAGFFIIALLFLASANLKEAKV